MRARGGTVEVEERADRGRTRTREENNINNNMDSSRKSRYYKTLTLYNPENKRRS